MTWQGVFVAVVLGAFFLVLGILCLAGLAVYLDRRDDWKNVR